MKIALFGGTGRVGQAFVNILEKDGRHSVYALVRTENAGLLKNRCRTLTGNARNQADARALIAGADIVVSCLNTDGDDTLTVSIENIINAMNEQNKKRLITIGTAGILNARQDPKLYRFETNESKRRSTRAAREHAKVYERLARTNLDWTIICPTYLPDGPAVQTYRTERDFLPLGGKEISTGDTAHFLLQVSESDQYIKTRVGIAY
ncbi:MULTISPECIES: NAD(P)-dependent oxidoreductase [Bacillus]|uniref:NAD(P)-dependent oxidoreductase n=1 Tax=Bacillus TaxID=1386 RepID=UPI00047D55A0|nr:MULTISPECIES: NAD(P)H-binding protein [Bacillus]QHZ46074.1 NAD(P)H-binding protein [Bacillus sp. NSP9.1]WFA07359.1 NAD(P)H-binding protein [Bacillus sp. HSf4]